MRVTALLLSLILSGTAFGHGDEDHGDAKAKPAATQAGTGPAGAYADTAPAAGAASPQRLSDGSVFLPKPAQRSLGLRTTIARAAEHGRAVELQGRVVADPNAGGRVQASQSGRVEPGPRGLPALGQAVSKGQVLAYLRPLAGALDRGSQQAQLAELEFQLELARRRVGRLEQLEGSVPQKEIEAARVEAASLDKRRGAIGASLAGREALLAPVSGVISVASAMAGQVVEARETLFEIVDPQRLMVEAVAYDAALAGGLTQASTEAAGRALQLQFVGAGRSLREQALPLLFRIAPPLPPLAVGQPLKVVAQTAERRPGVALPAAALVKSPSGTAVVWLHESAERFVARAVRVEPLDAARVLVTEGLRGGERVVVQGAAALAQVR